MSGCHPSYLEMPVCEHLVPMKFACIDCKRDDASPFIREIQKIKDRLDELERFQKIMQILYKNNKLRKPFKCPVCDGSGKRDFKYGAVIECSPCEGKGIVWDK